MIAASAAMAAEALFLQQAQASWEEHRLEVFVSSMAFDSTKERLNIPLHEGMAREITRSSWNVFVSYQGQSWSRSDDDAWYHIDVMRPNVPPIRESADIGCMMVQLCKNV